MSKRAVVDLMLIVALYALYWFCIYLAVSYNLPQQLEVTPQPGVDEADFLASFNYWSQVVMGISLVTALGWYAIGAWGPKPHTTSHTTWTLIWLVGLAVNILAGFGAIWLGPQVSDNLYILALYYLAGGTVFYYLSSMLFSPTNVKFEVVGAKVFRRGW